MTYKLAFRVSAEKEWRRLDPDTRRQFSKKLIERLENPKVASARLHGMKDCYMIKLATRGYRLVYQVKDDIITVEVIAVGKREGGQVYDAAWERK